LTIYDAYAINESSFYSKKQKQHLQKQNKKDQINLVLDRQYLAGQLVAPCDTAG